MKLHELLAVEGNLETQRKKCAGQLEDTFQKKRHLFEEKRVTFFPSVEGLKETVESQSDIQTSVTKEIEWIKGIIAPSWDASFQVAEANTRAKADIVLEDGTILIKEVPATALLELEKYVVEVQKLIESIPTLDPAKGFRPDDARTAGTYVAREVNKNRTQKTREVLVLYPATEQHPAQTQAYDKDVSIGRIQEQEWSSLITPANKADLLVRVEQLGRAVRRARSRANEVEVNKDLRIGNKLLDYVFSK